MALVGCVNQGHPPEECVMSHAWPDTEQPAVAELTIPIGHDPALEPTPIYDTLTREMWPSPEEP